MSQQRAPYPLDYSAGQAANGKEAPRATANAASDKVGDAAQDLAEQLAQQARVYGEQAQEAIKKFKPYVEKSMKEQPMTTLAVAAAVGALLGVLWKK